MLHSLRILEFPRSLVLISKKYVSVVQISKQTVPSLPQGSHHYICYLYNRKQSWVTLKDHLLREPFTYANVINSFKMKSIFCHFPQPHENSCRESKFYMEFSQHASFLLLHNVIYSVLQHGQDIRRMSLQLLKYPQTKDLCQILSNVITARAEEMMGKVTQKSLLQTNKKFKIKK